MKGGVKKAGGRVEGGNSKEMSRKGLENQVRVWELL